MKRVYLFLLLPLLFLSHKAFAQDGNNPVSYSNLALQYYTSTLNGDAANSFVPSVATANGYGSYFDNPASMALMDESSFTFSVMNTNLNQESTYLNNSVMTDRNKFRLGNLGFVYKFPTERGSFVVGGGYNYHTNNVYETRINGFNANSTITDQFRNSGSAYHDLAFETYAIDYATTDSSYLESIFRIGIDYPGITQDAGISHSTNMADYSLFMGTEFQKNLYFGVSAGITSGNYTYRRDFMELDEQNVFNGDFIEGSDIDNILIHDEIDADIVSFNLRTGLIYAGGPLNIGVSYEIPARMQITENYYSSIETQLDDGSEPFFYDIASSRPFNYVIKQPGKLSLGLAATHLNGFTISAAAELIDYSKTRIDLITAEDLDYADERIMREEQEALNAEIRENYKTVLNLRAGLKYEIDQFEVRAAYAFLPGRTEQFSADRNILSGGIGINLSPDIVLNLSGQYSFWNDQSEAYSYYDNSGQLQREMISQNMTILNFMAGLTFNF